MNELVKYILVFSGKKSLLILFIISFANLIMDLLSVTLIFPFLSLFVDPNSLLRNKYTNKAYQLIGFNNVSEIIYIAGLILIAVYIFKMVIKTIFNKIKYQIFADINYRLSTSLFEGLLGSKYSLFTEKSLSEMISIVNQHTVHSVICLDSLVKILNEIIFVFILLCIGLYINPSITILSILFFVFLGLLIYFGLIRKIKAFGTIHTRLHTFIYKYSFAIGTSIKDIKIMRLEDSCSQKFSDFWQQFSQNDGKSKAAKNMPVDLSEMFVFSGIVLVCLYLQITNQDIKSVFPFLGVLALIAMRLLPSFNRIISGHHEYRYYEPSLILVRDLSHKIDISRQQIKHLELPFKKCLEIRGLSFSYSDKKILDSISLKIKKGDTVAFIGESGAGKSTLLDLLVGLRQAETGLFYMDDIEFDPFNTDALRNYIGYVPQNVTLVDESLAFNIAFEVNFDSARMSRAISAARLEAFVNGLSEGVNTILGEGGVRVSGGQKQRIGVARALYRDPQILIFDEATSALDAVTERELMQEINQLSADKTLIIVAHRLSTVENCKQICLLDKGRIIAMGSQAELLKTSAEYRDLYYQQGHPQ